MKKIALIITGGTIGMNTSDGESKIPDQPLNYEELNDLKSKDLSITSYVLCYKDSSSIGVDIWQLLINKLSDLIPEYDGFIVSHGTDTMAYSAAAVAYNFGTDLECPIVFTGSCISPDLADTDAWRNLKDSVDVACSDIGEVVVVFAGKVWRASRATKIVSADNAIFTTPQIESLAQIDKNKLVIQPHCRRTATPAKPLKDPARFSDNMIFINAMPAMNKITLADFAKNPTWKLCLIQGMGEGNLTDELINFIEVSFQHNKHIVIRPMHHSRVSSIYPPLKRSLDLGAILAEGYSLCSLWVKLSWLLGRIELQKEKSYSQQRHFIRQGLSENIVGELVLS